MGPGGGRAIGPGFGYRVRRWFRRTRTKAATAGRAAWDSRRAENLFLTVLTGVATGTVIAAVDFVLRDRLFPWVADRPVSLQAVLPTAGLLLAAVSLRWLAGGAMSTTADEYVRTFHDPERRLDLRELPGRLLAAISTVGLGAPLGVEGTAAYAGAAIGSSLQERYRRFFSESDMRRLLVAGAAAGVGAIFRAPATGALFAMEVLYQRDVASRALVPALVGSTSSYITFSAIRGTDSIFSMAGSGSFDRFDLVGIALLGVVCGVAARCFVAAVAFAKRAASLLPLDARLALAAVVFAPIVVVGDRVFEAPVVLGVGYSTVLYALEPERALSVIALLLLLRAAGTLTAIGGGGVGGLFVPLVVLGALLGRLVAGAFDPTSATLYPIVGMAAFLGAGFRTPLAAVVFVAETTGGIGFVAPAIVATTVAQLIMGDSSISPFQRLTQDR